MKKELTREEEKLMSVVRNEWLDRIFKCSLKQDKEKIQEGINWIYGNIGKPCIIHVSSPMAAQYAVYYLTVIFNELEKKLPKESIENIVSDTVRNNVENNVLNNVRNNVWNTVDNTVRNTVFNTVWNNVLNNVLNNVRYNVENNVLNNVLNNVRNNVLNNVGNNVLNNVLNNVWNNVLNNVRNNVLNNVGNNVDNTVRNTVFNTVWNNVSDNVKMKYESFSFRGIGDYGWLSYYDFFTRINVIKDENFNKYCEFIKAGVYDMITLKGFCIVCEMPVKIKRNDSGQLHCTTESSIEWSDGYSQWYINGRSIPVEIFDKCLSGKVTKEDFIHEPNEENKAAIYEILGQEKMIKLLGAKEVDKGTFVHENGELEEVILYKTKEKFKEAGDNPLAWVKFICPSTGTSYLIDVEPRHTDARLAAISTSPLFTSIEDYQFTDRT
jgi:hypothetical protein